MEEKVQYKTRLQNAPRPWHMIDNKSNTDF